MLRLIQIESRQLLRDRMAMLLLAVLVAACAIAFFGGRATLQGQSDSRALSRAEHAKVDAAFRERLAATLPAEEAVLLPYRTRMGLTAELPVLVDFNAGRAVFENHSTQITLRTRDDTLFKQTNTENAELLMRGAFDLGFVVVVLAPLLLIGLGYGLFAADRDSGIARLILAQAGRPTRMLIARSLPRGLLVVVPILSVAALLLLTGPELPGRGMAAMRWLAIGVLLLAFWWAVVLFVNSLGLTAESSALALVSLWALFTLVLPSAVTAVAESAYPPPSRYEQIATARAAEVASTTAYENDHPEAVSEDAAGRLASIRKTWEIAKQVDAAVAPINARFERQLAEQHRLVRSLGWFSPSMIAAEAMTAQSGTDTATWLEFRTATRAYLDAFREAVGRHVETGSIIDADAYGSLPRFSWRPAVRSGLSAMLVLGVLSLVIGGAAFRRLSRVRLDD